MTSVTISLPESLKEFIEVEVRTKGYGNVSEYMRGLLRAQQASAADARLEALLLEGLATGDDIELTPDFWRELKADAAEILAAKRSAVQRPTRKTQAAK